jgi:hypothetical protein
VVFFQSIGLSSLFEAFGSPEKSWLLCIKMLGIHLFDIATFFRHDGLQAAAEKATTSITFYLDLAYFTLGSYSILQTGYGTE